VTVAGARPSFALEAAPTAWLFPGQGAEAAGRLRSGPGRATRLLERAGRALELDLVAAVDRGDPRLARTAVAQPTLVALCVGIAQDLEAAGEVAHAVAGHSLGELSAMAAAGCLAAEDAVDLAVERGRLMAEAARESPGGMVALRASDRGEIERLLALARASGRIAVAARNSPTQWVLSGDRRAIGAVAAATPVTVLPTGGAWHSEAMAEAETRWLAVLRGATFRPPRCPLILNRHGRALEVGDDPAALLAGQLTRPVEWWGSIEALARLGVARGRAIGPGQALRALCREILGDAVDVIVEAGGRPS
jgi:[acyl-carrier-protein] S-malonyltransferase